MTLPNVSESARRAASLYDEAYARKYRAHDDEFEASRPCVQFAEWLTALCAGASAPMDVLDLGCGTGRYFWALAKTRSLVGLDVSAAMLAEARHPYRQGQVSVSSIELVEGDLLADHFGPARFDLVYSIGVLAEHAPLNESLVARVHAWLRPGGRFAFTTVHPESSSIPRTTGRRLGELMAPMAPAFLKKPLRERLLAGGMYADETRVRELLDAGFAVESLSRFQSEAHLHCLCVARKRG